MASQIKAVYWVKVGRHNQIMAKKQVNVGCFRIKIGFSDKLLGNIIKTKTEYNVIYRCLSVKISR